MMTTTPLSPSATKPPNSAKGGTFSDGITRLKEDAIQTGCLIDTGPQIRRLAELSLQPSDDPNNLLGDRFLCRQGSLLMVAPTGVGKSSATMQMALLWSVGRPAFEIQPNGSLTTLIIQAENDDGDLAEMRDGVINGMIATNQMTDEEAEKAVNRVFVIRDVVNSGADVGEALRSYLEQCPCDLVILDPAFSYLGGESNSASEVGQWLRTIINPILIEKNVGLIIVHHTNKPLRGIEKKEWQAGDFAYVGAGSAEWANWARGVMSIRSIGSDSVFQLLAGKRGKRIGWKNEDGERITSKLIKHSSRGICWLPATDDDVKTQKKGAEHISVRLEEALEIALEKVWKVQTFKGEMASRLDIPSERKLVDLVKLVGEQDSIGRGRYNTGQTPTHLIGPKLLVQKHVKKHKRSKKLRASDGENS